MKFVGSTVALILVVGAAELATSILFGLRFPDWSTWQYLGTIVGLGTFTIIAELLFTPINRILLDPDKVSDPPWKRLLRAAAFVLLALGLLFGTFLWQFYQPPGT